MKATSHRSTITLIALSLLVVVLLPLNLVFGSIDIPFGEVVSAVFGGEVSKATWQTIVLETRLPMALTATLAGAALAVAGLLLQTTFDNPLAGPSILGVSTGSSLGVAIVMLAMGGVVSEAISSYLGILLGAIVGAAVVMLVLLFFSTIVKSTAMLLIIGIMVGYLTSSAISLLNFFSTQEGVHSFVIWGMGNFSGVTLDRLPLFAILILEIFLKKMLRLF
jgi:iron complex transport system permease protein